MRQFSAAQWLAAFISLVFMVSIAGCSSDRRSNAGGCVHRPGSLHLEFERRSSFSRTAIARDGTGTVVAVDFTFSSSNPALASISSAGLVCGGQFDTNSIVCSPNGDGQVTITVTSGNVSATATVYVHKQVDRVVMQPIQRLREHGHAIEPGRGCL